MNVIRRLHNAYRRHRANMSCPVDSRKGNVWKHDSMNTCYTKPLYRRALRTPGAVKRIMDASIAEDETNCWYAGILSGLAMDSIGPCPLIAVDLDNFDEESDAVEDQWLLWCSAAGIGGTIRTLRRSAARTGCAIGVFYKNEQVDHPIKLDIKTISPERIETPPSEVGNPKIINGFEFNENWDIVKIHVKEIEETTYKLAEVDRWTEYETKDIIFWFKEQVENQYLGSPECGQAMLLFPSVSRYVQAIIRSEELHASIPMALKLTDAYEVADTPAGVIPWHYEPGMIPTLPPGTDLTSVNLSGSDADKASFIRLIVSAAARCINMPGNRALGDSSQHNMSSAAYDMQPWQTFIRTDRHDFSPVLNKIYKKWWDLAILKEDYFGKRSTSRRIRSNFSFGIPHTWHFDTILEHPDPQKRANADATALESGATTLPLVYASMGKNARREIKRAARLYGLSKDEYQQILIDKFKYSSITIRETHDTNYESEESNPDSTHKPKQKQSQDQ